MSTRPVNLSIEISFPSSTSVNISIHGSPDDALAEAGRANHRYTAIEGAVVRPSAQAENTAQQKQLLAALAKMLPAA